MRLIPYTMHLLPLLPVIPSTIPPFPVHHASAPSPTTGAHGGGAPPGPSVRRPADSWRRMRRRVRARGVQLIHGHAATAKLHPDVRPRVAGWLTGTAPPLPSASMTIWTPATSRAPNTAQSPSTCDPIPWRRLDVLYWNDVVPLAMVR